MSLAASTTTAQGSESGSEHYHSTSTFSFSFLPVQYSTTSSVASDTLHSTGQGGQDKGTPLGGCVCGGAGELTWRRREGRSAAAAPSQRPYCPHSQSEGREREGGSGKREEGSGEGGRGEGGSGERAGEPERKEKWLTKMKGRGAGSWGVALDLEVKGDHSWGKCPGLGLISSQGVGGMAVQGDVGHGQ